MKLNKLIFRLLFSAVLIGMMASGAMAVTFFDFTVNDSWIPGVLDTSVNPFIADKITGGYTEVITFTSATTFDVSLKWEAGQFFKDDGVTLVTTYLNNAEPVGYKLYGTYLGSGSFATDISGATTFTTNVGSGGLSLYIDPSSDTTLGQPASGNVAWSRLNFADDILIATGTPRSGSGTLNPNLSTCQGGGINCGSFGTSTTFSLTNPSGMNYFVAPVPFYGLSFQSGQFNNFNPSGTQVINGSMDVVFAPIPEPSTLVLLGFGLIGTAVSIRRKRK